MLVEIYGPSGRIHYRRPVGDPLVEEAIRTPGYAAVYVERETVETPGVCTWCGGSGIEEERLADCDKRDHPCRYCGVRPSMSILSKQPDGMGFYYGFHGSDPRQVNVRYGPEDLLWRAYVGGVRVGDAETGVFETKQEAEAAALKWMLENAEAT